MGRFTQADSIIPGPGNPQAWDRYAYANNNPARYNDPTGHWIESLLDIASIAYDVYDISRNGLNWGTGLALAADVGGLILPGVTGLGVAARALTKVDDAVDALKAVDTAGDVLQAANPIDNAVDTAKAVDGSTQLPSIIYREGKTNPGNLIPRAKDNGLLSFRDSLSNPWPLPNGQRPVFRPGEPYFGVNTSMLPSGSVIYDNIPPGHISVSNVSPDLLKNAVVENGIFPK